MNFLAWITYLGIVVGLLFSPGNMNILAMTHSVRFGVKKSIGTALGSMMAGFCIMMISLAGLAAVVKSSPMIYIGIKWAGAAYLIYLGVDCLRGPGVNLKNMDDVERAKHDRSAFKLFMQSFLTGLGNPKGIIFFLSFFPQFINPEAPKLPQYTIMIITFMICDFSNMMIWSSSSKLIVPFLNSGKRGKIFNIATGSIFIGVGTLVALYNG